MITVMVLAMLAAGRADDGFALEFRPEKVFEVIPGSMVMNVEHMSQTRPAWVTQEPAYRNAPWYASLSFGEEGKPVAFALDEDDEAAVLYVDLNGNGDLTDDPRPGHERQEVPKEKRTPILKVWIYDLFTVKVAAGYTDGQPRELPITVRTYGKVCRDLNDHMKPDIVYWNSYYCAGEATFGGQKYAVAVKDQNCDGRFDTLKDAKHIRGDTVYIDTNRNGVFESRGEAFPLDKPFKIDGQAYEVARMAPNGGRVQFGRSAREVVATALTVGQMAPDFEIPEVGKLSSLRGKLVLVDFWATWCMPCLAEVPNVIKVHEEFKDRGFTVVGVSIDKQADAAKMHEVAKAKGMSWPEVHDHAQVVAKQYFVTAIPATFLIGPDGKIIATYLRGEDVGKEVEKAVGAKGEGK